MALTERDRTILEVERSWWAGDEPAGSKRQAIRAAGLSTSGYYEALARLTGSSDALGFDPLLVRRLRRARRHRGAASLGARPRRSSGGHQLR